MEKKKTLAELRLHADELRKRLEVHTLMEYEIASGLTPPDAIPRWAAEVTRDDIYARWAAANEDVALAFRIEREAAREWAKNETAFIARIRRFAPYFDGSEYAWARLSGTLSTHYRGESIDRWQPMSREKLFGYIDAALQCVDRIELSGRAVSGSLAIGRDGGQTLEDLRDQAAEPIDEVKELEAALTPQQQRLFRFLRGRRYGASFSEIGNACWDDQPSDSRVGDALKRLQSVLPDRFTMTVSKAKKHAAIQG